jgi:hypothetical protein
MSGPLFFAVLMAVVIAFGVAMFWQESKRIKQPHAVYGVEDSIEFIWLAFGDAAHGLKKSDVRRILEWEMHYLQQPHLWESEDAPVFGGRAAAEYVQAQSLAAGYSYEPDQIFAVFDMQTVYLEAIGAVGDPVDGEKP